MPLNIAILSGPESAAWLNVTSNIIQPLGSIYPKCRVSGSIYSVFEIRKSLEI